MILYRLFITFLQIGIFSFGGGYAMIPFIEKIIIHSHKWLTLHEFIDMMAISQMTPGPISINAATFVGYQIDGVAGAITATLGVVTSSLLLVTVVSKYFLKFKDCIWVQRAFEGIRPIVLALILGAALSIAKTAFVDLKSVAIGAAMFFLLYKYDLHPILIILISGVLGVLLYP